MENIQKKFLELYEPIKENVWRYCLFLTHNRENAKDLLGETIALTYKNFENIKDKKALLAFMFTIAHRIFYKYFKKNKNFEYEPEKLEFLFSYETQPDKLTDIKILLECLEKLANVQKEALILSEVEGFSRKEISIIQNVSQETVKSRIYRAKQKLKQLMGVNDEKDS